MPVRSIDSIPAGNADPYVVGDRSSTLIFCVNLAHVASLTETFREAGIDARYVTGNTKESERKSLVEAFKAGEFPVLINCQLFTEGTDIPNVSARTIDLATRSRAFLDRLHHHCPSYPLPESVQPDGKLSLF